MRIKLKNLLYEDTPTAKQSPVDFWSVDSWSSAPTEKLVKMYVSALETALKKGVADKLENQKQFKLLHNKIAEKLGGNRELATLEIMKEKDKIANRWSAIPSLKSSFSDSDKLPKDIKIARDPSDNHKIIMYEPKTWKNTEGFYGYDGEGQMPARSLTPEEKKWEWDSDDVSEYLPKIKKAIDSLDIPFEKTVYSEGSYHEQFFKLAVKISPENAIRIIEFYKNGLYVDY